MKRLVLLLTALATALAFSIPAVAAQSDDQSADNDYLIVTLTGEGAAYGNAASTNGRFDPDSQGYARIRDRMERQHERFATQLARKAPGAEIINEFFVTTNALTVKLNGADPAAIGSINGVQSAQRSTLYTLDMNESVGLIGADDYWQDLSGPSNAGSGVDVAVIDSGIDATHPFFDCTVDGGDKKVNFGGIYYSGQGILPQIPSASAIFGPGYTPEPGGPLYFFSDHGTHVAGTIGGCETTIDLPPEDFSNVWNDIDVSGVAPGAQLFDYNVFPFIGAGVVAFGGSAFSHDIAEAIEDAVADDMDVINMSLGGGVQGPHDFLAEVSNGAVAAGVTVVTSAGNEGDDSYTVGSPASASEVISVGATTNSHRLLAFVTEDPGGDEVVYEAAVGEFPDFDGNVHDLKEWPGSDPEACTSDVEDDSLSDEIVLISRGSCSFSQKMENANHAGAYGVIVYNNVEGDPIAMARSTGFEDDIPAVMVSKQDGADLLEAAPSTAEVTPRLIDPVEPNLMADFSSRGPTPFTDIVKPDVVAPGVNVLSSVMDFTLFEVTGHSWELFAGTSMASPHVAGAAALLLDDHPDWKPEQVKSALVTTAYVLDELTVWDQGAGLIQLAPDDGAGDATVFFYPANASFGGFQGNAPANGSVDIAITGTGGSCTVEDWSGDFVSASVNSSGSTLNVEFEGGRSAPSGMYDGYVFLDCGGDDYHIPWGAVVDRSHP